MNSTLISSQKITKSYLKQEIGVYIMIKINQNSRYVFIYGTWRLEKIERNIWGLKMIKMKRNIARNVFNLYISQTAKTISDILSVIISLKYFLIMSYDTTLAKTSMSIRHSYSKIQKCDNFLKWMYYLSEIGRWITLVPIYYT